ncbi:outer membrane beta-barrel protein [Zunongwangia endophytica]|uniref:Outer membrane beta-barrel protein n=1 Tax=Zunongwangia endophytica TaxID=1808945 RepID=A0ABV8H7L1_9FLAO|nr:outer membrane beta-barrel protein [Zunongwangia endophytica]MDN3595553.1 outer membrane beta-barrel protein [Zunongwangia endophytica]
MVKKLFLVMVLFVGINSFAQEVDFGFQAGYANVRISEKASGYSLSENESGFYLGFLADFHLNENWHIQPSVNYMRAKEVNFLSVPVLAQYYIAESGFFVQAGPQATFILEDVEINTVGLDAAFGVGYHIDENFFIDARYGVELTNRYSSDDFYGDTKARLNTLNIGVGYKF